MAGLDETRDEDLMMLVQEGDHKAFATLVRRHTSRFHAAAFRMCANTDLSEDIVQEAFLKLWEKPQVWDGARGVKFTTWFYRVVTNLSIDKLRRFKKTAHPDALDYIADDKPRQEENMQAQETQESLEAAIQNLPERQRIALNLCFYEGLSNREAAEVMGIKTKALESLLMRAKGGVRSTLIREGLIEEQTRERQAYGR